ncbi:MAG TPA: HAMP domain-containing sensor histidine kinase [Cyclobacteriaceae bacterium]|jgi:signal transduction histidine kinase|nr:HAMP domain-containing sensor histidine kinase [Cyclobacteriaceae bacterium]
MQIRTRLTLQFTVLVSAILVLAFSVLYFFVWRHQRDEFRVRLHDKALTAAILLLKVDQVDSALLKTIDLSKRDVLFKENITVFDSLRKVLYTNDDSLYFKITDHDFKAILRGEQLFLSEGEYDILGQPFEYQGHSYVIISGAINIRGKQHLDFITGLLYLLTPLLIVIVAVAGWIFAGRALRPIVRVMKEVQEISPAEMTQRLTTNKNADEIGKLISIFNQLLERIEDAFKLQKAFVSNVSHELNNPLTKITSQLEVTLLNERENEEYKTTIHSVLDDIKELNALCSSLLELAYINQAHQTFHLTSMRVDELLWEIREDLMSSKAAYRIQVHIDKMPEREEDLCAEVHPQLFKTALTNFIENACKFSQNQTAFISLSSTKNEITISVIDKGPGIEKNEIKKIFQPFYRTDNTSKIKGYGIGLSLAERIIAIHRGNIVVNSTPGIGTEIKIVLKRPVKF